MGGEYWWISVFRKFFTHLIEYYFWMIIYHAILQIYVIFINYCEFGAKCPVFGRRKWHFLCRSLAIQLFYFYKVWKLFKFVPIFHELSQNCTIVLYSSEPPPAFLTSVENIWQIINLLKSALSAWRTILLQFTTK
jgi:hypothetical protein